MRKALAAIGIVCALILLSAPFFYWHSTVPPDYSTGIITSKHHEDGYWYPQVINKITIMQYAQPRWYIHYRHCDQGKCHTGEHDLDHGTYDRAHVGDLYDHGDVRPA